MENKPGQNQKPEQANDTIIEITFWQLFVFACASFSSIGGAFYGFLVLDMAATKADNGAFLFGLAFLIAAAITGWYYITQWGRETGRFNEKN